MTGHDSLRAGDSTVAQSQALVWVHASRPRTLSLSMTPVAVGAAIGWAATGHVRWMAVIAASLAAALIQIGTNLYNDASDGRRGGDGPERLGPQRVTASGLLEARQVERAAFLCFAGAAAAGFYLVLVGGWLILALGLVSIGFGLAYSGGPLPIAYTPLGEVLALVFFGVVAVAGTYWLACGAIGPAPIVAGVAIGLFAAAVLLVNNHRDRLEDARAGRRTVAILIGVDATRWLYAALMLAPFLMLAPLARLMPNSHVGAAILSAPFALAVVLRLFKEPAGRGLNAILARTAQVQLAFAILLCLGAIL